MTKVLILAAGQGTRLRPLTDTRPKCLVPLVGESLLSRQVKTLKSCNISNIHIATGYLSEKIEALGFPVSINERFASSNMVETLIAAKKFIQGNEDLIIAYGDIVYQKNNLETLLASEGDISLMIDKNWRALWETRLENPLDDAETLKLNEQGNIIELGKKPENYADIQGQYTGLIKVSGDKVSAFIQYYDDMDRRAIYDGKDFVNMYMTSFLQSLINNGWEVKAALVKSGWLEIDSVEDLKAYEAMYESGELKQFYDFDLA